MNYKKQLLDPRWQRRRLEILQRDEFTCQKCLSKDKTLHVHHTDYIKGRMAWEYENNELITMCKDCHYLEELIKKQKKLLLENMINGNYIFDRNCPACGSNTTMDLSLHYFNCSVCGCVNQVRSPKDVENERIDEKKYQEYLLCQE